MFDFHIHVNCSGGRDGLLPSEAMRLAKCAGFRAVGLIVRADPSTLPILLPTLKTLVKTCSLYAGIEAFAGVELVHVPPALLPDAVGQAREQGAALILAHGESIPRQLADVVETGTNLAAINAGASRPDYGGRCPTRRREGRIAGAEHGPPALSRQRAYRPHGRTLRLRTAAQL